jgi:hypothetical protein
MGCLMDDMVLNDRKAGFVPVEDRFRGSQKQIIHREAAPIFCLAAAMFPLESQRLPAGKPYRSTQVWHARCQTCKVDRQQKAGARLAQKTGSHFSAARSGIQPKSLASNSSF